MKLFSQKLSRAKRPSPLNPNTDDPQGDTSSSSLQQQTPVAQPPPPEPQPLASKSETTISNSKQSSDGRSSQKRKLYPFHIDRKQKDVSRSVIPPTTTSVEQESTSEVGSPDSIKPQFVEAQPPNAVWALDAEPDMTKKPPALPAPMPSPSELSRAIAEAAHAKSSNEPITAHPSMPQTSHLQHTNESLTRSSPPSRKSSPPPATLLTNSSRAPDASLSAVTTSAEISNPPSTTTSSSKLRSVPIPQPLLLKRHTSRSSFSSADDAINDSSLLLTPSSAHMRNSLSSGNLTGEQKQQLMDSAASSSLPLLSPITSTAGSQDEQDNGSPALLAKSYTGSPARAMSTVTGSSGGIIRKKISHLHDMEYGSSASEAEPSDTAAGNNDLASPSAASSFTNESPISQSQTTTSMIANQSSASPSPKFASPPVGSGGKYMLKSKRASWIDANAAHPPPISTNFAHGEGSSGSTPSTPISGNDSGRLIHSRKNSVAEGMNTLTGSPALMSSQSAFMTTTGSYSPSLAASKELDEADLPATTTRLYKTSSISRMSDSGTKSIPTLRRRESSIDFPSSGSEGSSRFVEVMPRRLPRRSSTLESGFTDGSGGEEGVDNQMASSLPPPYALPASFRDIFQHKRTPSLSSTLTGNSIDEHSPLTSPVVRNPPSLNTDESQQASPTEQRSPVLLMPGGKSVVSSKRERTASSSSLMTTNSNSLKSTTQQAKTHRRRSSMSVLRKIPTEELASIVSGSSPNPVVPPPMAEAFNRQRSRTHTIATSHLSNFQTFEDHGFNEQQPPAESQSPNRANSLPGYQNSLHSFMKRQFHAHSDAEKQYKRSSSLADKDRDVTEMSLDDDGPAESSSYRNRGSSGGATDLDSGFKELRAPIFPSSLLNTPYPMPISKKDSKKFAITRATASTSAPHLLQDDDDNVSSISDGSAWPESNSKYKDVFATYKTFSFAFVVNRALTL
jgi:hypothetical protein